MGRPISLPRRGTARFGDLEATHRQRCEPPTFEVEREQIAADINDVMAAGDDFEALVTMPCHPDLREYLLDESAVRRTDPLLVVRPRRPRCGAGADPCRAADAAAVAALPAA
jgi:hypothetical protein